MLRVEIMVKVPTCTFLEPAHPKRRTTAIMAAAKQLFSMVTSVWIMGDGHRTYIPVARINQPAARLHVETSAMELTFSSERIYHAGIVNPSASAHERPQHPGRPAAAETAPAMAAAETPVRNNRWKGLPSHGSQTHYPKKEERHDP
jgi:hypothetical protein